MTSMLIGEPFERVSVDITDPIPPSSKGNVFMLMVMDHVVNPLTQSVYSCSAGSVARLSRAVYYRRCLGYSEDVVRLLDRSRSQVYLGR